MSKDGQATSQPQDQTWEGLTISRAEAKALLYGVPIYDFSTALSRIASWLAERDDETPTPPGNQIRTAECDGKDAVPVTGQLPVGTASPHEPSPAPNVTCPCTTFEQSEDCPVGYPSLLCSACDGKGNAPVDKVVALAAEMMKIAEQAGEVEDPFAAWETIDLIKSQHEKLRGAGQGVVSSASDTYKKRNGHLASFEDESGEKCWIVPFDAFEELRAAVATASEGSTDA